MFTVYPPGEPFAALAELILEGGVDWRLLQVVFTIPDSTGSSSLPVVLDGGPKSVAVDWSSEQINHRKHRR